jgi:glycogen debranching enzyme
MRLRYLVVALTLASTAAAAQQSAGAALHPIEGLHLREDGPVLRSSVQFGQPFTVAGMQGVVLGQQQGTFEAWVLPVKLLSQMTIEADVQGYDVPIDLNSMAREISVRPDHTTITYSHIALTVRQIMFAPDGGADGTGAVVLFQVDSLHPVDLIFRFTAEMRNMWPEPNFGTPSAEWVKQGDSGLYILHTDFPSLAGAVAIPGATHGVMAPYQERPAVYPLEFHLHIDPKTDRDRLYPLLMAVGRTKETATSAVLEAKLQDLDDHLPAIYATHAAQYRQQEQTFTAIKTPDQKLNADFGWAETSIGQLRAKAQPSGEIALVAGYYASGDSARPGFGWFFGRDSLYTLYAVNSYGDFALSREELEFLMKRQRADGKMMHEYSQTAAYVDWSQFPYEYAAADSTPLFLTAMLDYVRSSGDVAFLRAHRDEVEKAWHFETTHAGEDGVYNNEQGTGWVESWPPGMPRQEIYLALLDQQASAAMAQLETLLANDSLGAQAKQRAAELHKIIEHEYYRTDTQTYAFSRNAGGVMDDTATVFPSLAWWNGGAGLDHPAASLKAWASHDFATDWGLRDLAASDKLFDSMSYHQGSVWPLFTGWEAVAQYRAGQSLAGYQSAMQNADLTQAQDIGAVTELLSGDFFVPFGRSTSHQLWSSAMLITPLMRGLFGIDVDALRHALTVTPHLPADWPDAEVDRLRVGESVVNLCYKREAGAMVLLIQQVSGPPVHFAGSGATETMRIPLPAFEVSIGHGLPLPGARTAQMKVLNEKTDAHSLTVELEGMAGSEDTLYLRRNNATAKLKVEGAALDADTLRVHFPTGSGYVPQTVTLRW